MRFMPNLGNIGFDRHLVMRDGHEVSREILWAKDWVELMGERPQSGHFRVSAGLVVFCTMWLAVLPATESGAGLADELKSAREEVSRLDAEAHEEHPDLYLFEEAKQEARQLAREDRYRSLQKKTTLYISQFRGDKDTMSWYQKLRRSYKGIADSKLFAQLLSSNATRSGVLECWRMLGTELYGETVAAMNDAEHESFLLSAMKEEAENAQEMLLNAQKAHEWPSYVTEFCQVWAEAEVRLGAARILAAFRTPSELKDARKRLRRLEIQAQNYVEAGEVGLQ